MHPVILTLPMGHFLQSSTPTGACPLLWVTCHFYHPSGPVLQGGPAGGKEKGEVQGHWEVMDRKPELYRLFPATRPVRDAGRVLSPTVLVGPRHTDPFVKGFFFRKKLLSVFDLLLLETEYLIRPAAFRLWSSLLHGGSAWLVQLNIPTPESKS